MDKVTAEYKKDSMEIFSTKKRFKKTFNPMKKFLVCIRLKHLPMKEDEQKEQINIEDQKQGILECVSGLPL